VNKRAQLYGIKVYLLLACLQGGPACAVQTPDGKRPVETAAPTKIAGTVVSAVTGMPLGQARISISDTKNRANILWMTTSENGRFEFDHVPAGKYALQGAKRGYLPAAYEQHEQFSTAIVTGTAFDTTKLVLRLTPMASIEGRVIDEAGEPVREGLATLYRENHGQGITRITPVDREKTDDLGTFEFTPLAPGKYFVSVSAKPWYSVHGPTDSGEGHGTALQAVDRSLDVTYPTTYSGDATVSDGALAIELKGGEYRDVEVHIYPVPSLHLTFRVPEQDGQHGVPIPTLEKRVFDSSESLQVNEVRSLQNGAYEVSGVPAGTYSVKIPGVGSQLAEHTSEMELRTDGQELDTNSGEPEGSMKLRIQMPQQEAIPSAMSIMLLDHQNENRAFQEVDQSGETAIEYLPAGKYSIVIYSPGRQYSVVKTSSEGRETAGREVNVSAGGTLSVTALLAMGIANIEGFVERGGKAAAGVMVVLIPRESSTREDLFRRDQSDSDGSFSLRSVIPGDYSLVAIDDAWGFDWSKPGELARYAQHGQAVTIPEGVQVTIELSEPIEVQSR
jgi:Carboxypeptidase regulatory-like domain